MNHRRDFREQRIPPRSDIRGGLERHVGATIDVAAVEALARRANRETELIVFTPAMLGRLEPYVRTVIEGAARRVAKGRA